MSFLDLNEASEQSTGMGSAIPPNSCVVVKIHLRSASEASSGKSEQLKQGSKPLLIKSKKSSLEYLDAVMEVVDGKYKGRKIYHKFNCLGAQNDGQRKAVDISRAQIRALVECAKGIDPKDNSPQACQARKVDLEDLEGMVFPILVDCEQSQTINKTGTEYYCNNVMKRIIVSSDIQWTELREKGEVISDEPVPTYPVASIAFTTQSKPPYNNGSSEQTSVTPPFFASQPQAQTAPKTQTMPTQQDAQRTPPPNRVPAWGQQTQVDRVPFK